MIFFSCPYLTAVNLNGAIVALFPGYYKTVRPCSVGPGTAGIKVQSPWITLARKQSRPI